MEFALMSKEVVEHEYSCSRGKNKETIYITNKRVIRHTHSKLVDSYNGVSKKSLQGINTKYEDKGYLVIPGIITNVISLLCFVGAVLIYTLLLAKEVPEFNFNNFIALFKGDVKTILLTAATCVLVLAGLVLFIVSIVLYIKSIKCNLKITLVNKDQVFEEAFSTCKGDKNLFEIKIKVNKEKGRELAEQIGSMTFVK